MLSLKHRLYAVLFASFKTYSKLLCRIIDQNSNCDFWYLSGLGGSQCLLEIQFYCKYMWIVTHH